MTENLRDQIYNNMLLKETDELIQIWQQHNIEDWTETALEVVREILQNRLGELPPQVELNNEIAAGDTVDDPGIATETLNETAESNELAEKGLVCSNCTGKNLLLREVGIKYGPHKVVLIKPRTFFETLIIEEEIVGIACEDCGFVFFMLKDYV